jgi:hypothetical protein
MEKDSFFIFSVCDLRCQWREPTPMKRGRWELEKKQEVEKSENFLPVYFVKILLGKIQKWRWKYETFVSKS